MSRIGATVAVLLFASSSAFAQVVIDDSHSHVAFEQTDAWAMAYVGSSTLMTGFGAVPALDPGDWQLSGELGHIPRLSAAEQRVGLGGGKQEDLNKSPVFGRGRLWLGLPYRFVFELGYTPPLEIDGAKPQDLFSVALGRRVISRANWSLSARMHGQHGAAVGDVTCPADLAGNTDPLQNPFGCLEPSQDRIALNQYGVEMTTAFGADDAAWQGHVSVGAARFEPVTQIRAELRTYRNRTVLTSSGTRPYLALGVTRASASRWQWSGELLYVPLKIKRPTRDLATEAFWSLRVLLRFQPQGE